ncbi:hypothetical protein PR048_012755 [Dryococelus australis]|uniref:Reverse transcriptase domain-containing protein n=1 Tax=Dryococelus australis TaxID=614101 RepID=A0ABQ9HQ93_9NEOP|nr:hypothetical protein PR048_012755 [Dryococelus australis]
MYCQPNRHREPCGIFLKHWGLAFENIVHYQYINNNFACLSPYQSGFRAKHSFATALTQSVTDGIRKKMDERKLTVLTMLDLSKAFKTVDYNMLLNKMSSLFILSLAAVQWFQSYFTDRRRSIKCAVWCPTRISFGTIIVLRFHRRFTGKFVVGRLSRVRGLFPDRLK